MEGRKEGRTDKGREGGRKTGESWEKTKRGKEGASPIRKNSITENSLRNHT